MKIVVNSGNVGTPVALELAKSGHQVTLTARSVIADTALDELGIRQVPIDINSLDSMTSALTGAEAFFSLTPFVERFVKVGCLAVQAAKAAGIRKIVRSSVLGAGMDAAIKLGRMHYAVEKAVEDSGIPFTILRPANFMQNYLSPGTVGTIKTQSAIFSAFGTGKLDAIDTRDISAVAARVLAESGHESKCYHLTGGEALSDDEIAELFSKALGRKIIHVNITEEQAKEGMAKGGMPPWLVDIFAELTPLIKAGYLAALTPDVEMLLKRKPIKFSQFIQDHLNAFKT